MSNRKIFYQKTILIDTCFLIDSYSHPNVFKPFIDKIRSNHSIIISIPEVKVEFIRSRIKDVVLNKIVYFAELVKGLFVSDETFIKPVEEIIVAYKNKIEGVSVADIYLAALLKRVPTLTLLTRNHKDFPLTLFSRRDIMHFELNNAVLTYATYSYGKS